MSSISSHIVAPTSPFDEIATSYDAVESGNPVFQWMRRRIHQTAEATFRPGERLLEIGCGTGTDAVFFAQRGNHVVAIDSSTTMLAQAQEKASRTEVSPYVEFRFHDVERLDTLLDDCGPASFDGVFSNFGVLNCLSDFRSFARTAAALLRQDGKVLLNIMPPFCPWEILYYVTRLQPSSSIRRWRTRFGMNGLPVPLGTRSVGTFYHSPRLIQEQFSPRFNLTQQLALGLLLPPMYLEKLVQQPMRFGVLARCEESVAGWPLLRNWGDHVVMVFQKSRNAKE